MDLRDLLNSTQTYYISYPGITGVIKQGLEMERSVDNCKTTLEYQNTDKRKE